MLPLQPLVMLPLLALALPWVWPVAAPHSIVRPYLAPETPYAPGHRGVDLAAPDGTVYAPADGIVHFAGTVVDRPLLSLEHAGGVLTSYEPVITDLAVGDVVARGQVIGVVIPGHCSELCLHFGVRVHGQYASPLAWLGGIERAVLLPTRRAERGARALARCRESRIRVNSRNPRTSAHPLQTAKGVKRRALRSISYQLHDRQARNHMLLEKLDIRYPNYWEYREGDG